jgi:hypothetical protein
MDFSPVDARLVKAAWLAARRLASHGWIARIID